MKKLGSVNVTLSIAQTVALIAAASAVSDRQPNKTLDAAIVRLRAAMTKVG